MAYELVGKKKLPEQDAEKTLLLIGRWDRAAGAHAKWAEPAKRAVDAVEGRQWDQDALKKLVSESRPALTVNQVNRLVRLVMGYFANNRTDISYLPGHDGSGDDSTAETITAIVKTMGELSQMPFLDTEVFMDGMMTGRGWFDTRLCFESNDLGELETNATDPFALYVDPDAQNYDVNKGCGFMVENRMACLDEIEYLYGKEARLNVEPFANGRTPLFNYAAYHQGEEISPIRRFGNSQNSESEWWDTIYAQLGNFYDPLRKSLRIMDFQHQMRSEGMVFVDLETGDTAEIPQDWQPEKIKKVLWWAEQNQQPLTVDQRTVSKIMWTTIIGDLIVYDRRSPYKTYTYTGYFPYFRRGITRGMVEDLLDPQMEINKRRSARIDTQMRVAHSGWKYHTSALTPEQKMNLKLFGSEPGFNLEWQGDPAMEPKKIEASAPAVGLRELEDKANEDLREVSGINEATLGEITAGQSGRALEARQRQSVIGIQYYFTNFSRTKELLGRKDLEVIQQHYTEQRVLRAIGTDKRAGPPMLINQRVMDDTASAMKIVNNVTLGKYRVAIDETPLASSFMAAQFEEMLALLQKLGPIGQHLAMTRPDLIIRASSLPHKAEWEQALMAAANAMPPPAAPPGPGAGPPSPAGPPPGGAGRPPPTPVPPPAGGAGAPLPPATSYR